MVLSCICGIFFFFCACHGIVGDARLPLRHNFNEITSDKSGREGSEITV